jgi:quinol monooxygenase YgiN
MARFTIVAALLLAFTVASVSARPGPAVNVNAWAQDIVGAMKGWSGARMEVEESALAAALGHEDEGEHKFNLLVKYIVRPSIAKDFIKEFLKVKDEAEDVKGCNMYTLSFDLSKNVEYWSYQQWESKKDFFEYIMSKDTEVKKLAEWIEEKDVVYTLSQLAPVAFHKEHHHHHEHGTIQRRASEAASQPMEVLAEILSDAADSLQAWVDPAAEQAAPVAQRSEHEHSRPFILSKFIVKPSELVHFVKAAELITDAVAEEKGNIAYGFSKALDDDVTFYNVAMWESKEAAFDFLKSKAAKCFLKYTLENNVYVTTTLLYPIEGSD